MPNPISTKYVPAGETTLDQHVWCKVLNRGALRPYMTVSTGAGGLAAFAGPDSYLQLHVTTAKQLKADRVVDF